MASAKDRYLQRVRVCHAADLGAFEPWFCAGEQLGWIHRDHVPLLAAAPPFAVERGRLVLLGGDFAERSAAVATLVARLAAEDRLPAPTGELYPVAAGPAAPARLRLERAAVPWFGVRAHGVHLNGYVRTAAGLASWVGRRARGKRTFPGHLDNLVAGGCASGMSPAATLVKEAHEEAGLPAALAAQAVGVGELAYVQQDGRCLKVDTLLCHDLELPATFVPRALDGEMESFALWPTDVVRASLRGDDPWKPNCALVAIDFLLRHGELDVELDADERSSLAGALRGARA